MLEQTLDRPANVAVVDSLQKGRLRFDRPLSNLLEELTDLLPAVGFHLLSLVRNRTDGASASTAIDVQRADEGILAQTSDARQPGDSVDDGEGDADSTSRRRVLTPDPDGDASVGSIRSGASPQRDAGSDPGACVDNSLRRVAWCGRRARP